MELLLIATYAAICVAVFKIFRIPLNKWTVPTAVLGGIFMIAAILLVMNYNHPFTATARIYFATTPIMPTVKGRVIEVPVKPNMPLKDGDVLFRIDPRPYQYVVDKKKAMLAEAEQTVKQLKTSYEQASATVEKVMVQLKLAQDEYARQLQLFEKKVIAQAALDIATRNIDGAKQSLAEAEAAAERAKLAYEFGNRRREYDGRPPASRAERRRIRSRPNCRAGTRFRLRDANGVAAGHVCHSRSAPSRHGVHPHRR